MYGVIKSVEEAGRVFVTNTLLSGVGVVNSVRSSVWSGLFSYGISSGSSPFNSGLVAGYFVGDERAGYLARTVRGGAYGLGIALSTRLINKIQHRQ